jgi:hypothetical protein
LIHIQIGYDIHLNNAGECKYGNVGNGGEVLGKRGKSGKRDKRGMRVHLSA